MFEIHDNVVMTVKEVPTKKQVAIVKEFYCYLKGIAMIADKASISADGSDTSVITCKWRKFDIEAGGFIDDASNTDTINVLINGTVYQVDDGQIEFTSLEPGDFIIQSVNDLAENCELAVKAL